MIDGEIVVEDDDGKSDFSALQAALKANAHDGFVYYVFDLLHLDGRDVARLPLIERKEELRRLVGRQRGVDPVQRAFRGRRIAGAQRRAARCRSRASCRSARPAPYRSGRTDAFVKIKCANAQELVVGGYAPSTAMPRAVGALVVGYYENGRLIYAGRVGTGYTHATARELWKTLQPLEIGKPPLERIPADERRRDVHWVEPRMVIEAEFRGWTADGLLRQAAFKGVREDKPAREVVREIPAKGNGAETPARPAKIAAETVKVAARKSKPAGTAPARAKARARAAPADGAVRFTHPERVYWADAGVTKQDLADYYRAAWEWMAPHVAGRPLAFLRCPDGTAGQCFFQKHASAGLDEKFLRSVIDKKRRQVLAIEELDGLLSLAQAGVLEVHVRGSKIDRLDVCDRIVFDLDPGEGVAWSDLVAAARDVRERLAGIKLESFVKLTGGKGLHVVLPIEGTDWDTAKTFAQALAHGDGGGRAQALRRQDDQVAARGTHLRRLSAQRARADRGRRLLHPRARRRAGVGAGDLGGARRQQGFQPVRRAQRGAPPRLAQGRSVGGDAARAPEAAGPACAAPAVTWRRATSQGGQRRAKRAVPTRNVQRVASMERSPHGAKRNAGSLSPRPGFRFPRVCDARRLYPGYDPRAFRFAARTRAGPMLASRPPRKPGSEKPHATHYDDRAQRHECRTGARL